MFFRNSKRLQKLEDKIEIMNVHISNNTHTSANSSNYLIKKEIETLKNTIKELENKLNNQ